MIREDDIRWYHSKITREEAEKKILEGVYSNFVYINLYTNSMYVCAEGSDDGVFLVRDSNTSAGDYVLSVLHQRQVVHYQIRKHGEDAFFSIGTLNFIF